MDWDYNFLYENYKDILLTCYSEGYLLPYYLTVLEIPVEYDYSFDEWNNILDKTSVEVKDKLTLMSKERRRNEILVLKGKNDNYSDLDTYYTDELNQFLKKYPRFKKIILKEN